MRTRTCLLAAFGVVVPLLAMFSHLIPRSVSEAVWQGLTRPLTNWLAADDINGEGGRKTGRPHEPDETPPPLATVARPESPLPNAALSALPLQRPPHDRWETPAFTEMAVPAPAASASLSPVVPTVNITVAASAAPEPRTAAGLPGPAPAPVRADQPDASELMLRDRTDAATRPVVEQAAMHEQLPPAATASEQVAGLRAALEQLGAFDIDHEITAGGGMHRCSCRLAADPTGQLQRVFHASDPDLREAMQRMINDVMAWQRAHPQGLQVEVPPARPAGSPL